MTPGSFLWDHSLCSLQGLFFINIYLCGLLGYVRNHHFRITIVLLNHLMMNLRFEYIEGGMLNMLPLLYVLTLYVLLGFLVSITRLCSRFYSNLLLRLLLLNFTRSLDIFTPKLIFSFVKIKSISTLFIVFCHQDQLLRYLMRFIMQR